MRRRGHQILVVDDRESVREVLREQLSELGYGVLEAADGLEALALLKRAPVDLVVTDLRMPNLSGQQLFEKVREERPELMRRFVFATGDLVCREALSFLEGLPNRIIAKPIEVETVRRVLSQAIRSATS